MSDNEQDIPTKEISMISEIKKKGVNFSSFRKEDDSLKLDRSKMGGSFLKNIESLKQINADLDEMSKFTSSGIFKQFQSKNFPAQVQPNSKGDLVSNKSGKSKPVSVNGS